MKLGIGIGGHFADQFFNIFRCFCAAFFMSFYDIGAAASQQVLDSSIPVSYTHLDVYKRQEIALVSIVHKITNLITSRDFIQSDAVSDTVKAAKYRIFFLSEDNEKDVYKRQL